MNCLFWDKSELLDHSWKIKSKVKLSSIPNAGNGRYTSENIQEGQIIRSLKIIKLKDYLLKFKNLDSDLLNEGHMIILESYDDLESLTQHLLDISNTNIELIKLKMSWYIAVINGLLIIHSFSAYYNHSDNNCLKYNFNEEGILKQIASKYIEKDSELFINYNFFKFPTYYIDWCKKNNLSTVLKNIK